MRSQPTLSMRVAAVAVAATLCAVTQPARAQTPAVPPTKAARPAPADRLPTAKEVLARYVAAVGGRGALMRHSSMRVTGTFEMPAAGVKGDFTSVRAKPDKFVMNTSIPGIGQMSQGYNGSVGWSVDPIQGPRLLAGKELAQLREESGFEAMLGSSPSVRSVESVERTEMGGQPCVKLKVTYESGREVFECYSVETGLLVGSTSKQDSPMGAMDVTTLVSDWKDFGGFKVATKGRQQAMGQEQVLTFTTVEYDRPGDAAAFETPAAIRALVENAPASPAPGAASDSVRSKP